MDYREWQPLARNPVIWIVLPLIAGSLWFAWQEDGASWLFAIPVLVFGALFAGGLSVRVTSDALRLALLPIWGRRIPLRDIRSARVIQYHWTRFGGWGIRYGDGAWAYSIWGKQAVRMEVVGKKDVVVTSRDPAALVAALHYAGVPTETT